MSEALMISVTEVLDLRRKKAELEAELDNIKKQLEKAENAAIAAMQSLGINSVKTDQGTTIGLSDHTYYDTPPKGSPQYSLAMSWLKHNGAADLVYEQINWQSLNSFLRHRDEEGEPIPDIFNTRHVTKLFVRSG